MKRLLLAMLSITMSFAYAFSQGFPTISTDESTTWYLIQFMNGGYALTDENDNAEINTTAPVGSDGQLWKITGNDTDGYTFTNKKGKMLFVSSAKKDEKVKVSVPKDGVLSPYNITTNISEQYEKNNVSNIVDGNTTSLWWTARNQQVDDYVTIEFEKSSKISKICLYFDSADRPAGAKLQYSTDNSAWNDIKSFTATDIADDNTLTCEVSVDAKYVRLLFTEGTDKWFKFREFEVYSSEASNDIPDTYKFFITETQQSVGGYEIQPKGNLDISMNLWEGTGGKGIGLYDKGDKNNPIKFVEGSLFENLKKISIIPQPQNITVSNNNFDFRNLNHIACNNDTMQAHLKNFAAQLKKSSGIELTLKNAEEKPAAGEIWFGIDSSLPKNGYTLNVNENGIEIKAADFGGEFYALQTLTQLLPREFFTDGKNDIEWSIPVVDIKDNPQFQHRGFMMDVSRHFFDKEQVKKVLDIMALYKMNRLHWHLTDDQGWRIEIPEYPKLTEVGSIRSGSFAGNGDGAAFFDDTEYGRGMWFSQKDLREIVAYTTERNIDILPEIDLPGHMVAAVTAYPEFSCDPTKEYSVRIWGGISKDVLNVGKDEVIDFLKCVLRNVAEIFPFPYIHLGGDECPTDQWKTNADCLRRVQEKGLAGVEELQSWLVEELGAYLKTLGENSKDIVVWDEVLKHWNTENKIKPVIMAWNGGGAVYAKQAADLGFYSILCPYSHVYIDFMQVSADQALVDEPYEGGWGVNTVEKVYSLNPLTQLDGKEEFCWGAQCNLWAETLNNNEELEYQLLPRMLALAEVGWLPSNKKNWTGFYDRLQTHDEILDALGYTYAKHYIEPKEYTAAETAIMESEELLANSIRGGVGYPTADVYDALQAALNTVTGEEVTALNAAITAFKNAEIVQPQEDKIYQIISASTYYKRQYAGSTMYVYDNGVRFHYTPQVEPEELWQFVSTENGYLIKNPYTGKEISMPEYNKGVVMANTGTPVKIEKATKATGNITYVPGSVLISDIGGRNSDDAQLWKITGNETDGYTFTNKKGYTLCVTSAAKNQMVKALKEPTGVSKFIISPTGNSKHSGGYEIHPKGNTNVSMNLWGGSENRGVGLWDKDNNNNPVTFIEESEVGKSNNSGFPDNEEKWYVIQFMEIKNAFTAAESGAEITTREASFGTKRLCAEVIPADKEKENWSNPCIYAKDVDALCYNGTWKIIEVTDYTAQLAGLVNKCELIVIRANEGRTEALTPESLELIQDRIITPASADVEAGNVTEEQYNAYVALYRQFQRIDYVTSIEKVKGENEKAKFIYDLQGRQINKITKSGIYIVDGRKTVVK